MAAMWPLNIFASPTGYTDFGIIQPSMTGGTSLNFTDAFVGDRVPVILNQNRIVPSFGSHERLAVGQP